jgi:hypothetical protein
VSRGSHVPYACLVAAFVVLATLVVRRASAAESLPGGVTCDQIVRYASDLNIPNTWRGRAQARVIALTFGIVITSEQLDAAARCLRQYRLDREDR